MRRRARQRLVLWMPADVSGGKGAAWNDRRGPTPGILQGCLNQFCSDPTVRKLRRNFRMRKIIVRFSRR